MHCEIYNDSDVWFEEQKTQYRQEHKKEQAERYKQYRQEHKKELAEKNHLYRQENKENIAVRRKQKYTCICGVEITHDHKARHERSKSHLANV